MEEMEIKSASIKDDMWAGIIIVFCLWLVATAVFFKSPTKTKVMKANKTHSSSLKPVIFKGGIGRQQSESTSAPVQSKKEKTIALWTDFIQSDNIAIVKKRAGHRSIDADLAKQIASICWELEDKYDLPRGHIVSQIHIESNCDMDAVSGCRARGLMQVKIVPAGRWAAEQLGLYPDGPVSVKIRAVMHPINNIKIGAFILNDFLLRNDGNLDKALAGYSGGAKNYATKIENFRRKLMAKLK